MISVENLSYSFPQKDLFNKISFKLEEGQHCVLIGASGVGKSTLLELLMNPDNYLFDGKLVIDSDCRMGYVSQFPQISKAEGLTVFDYIAQEFIKMQDEMTSICTEMETALNLDSLLENYQQCLDSFQAIDGDHYENNILKKLNLAGLNRHKDLLVSELSSGEFKLVQVIKEMLTSPSLLIMDEPDVFLDFERINALKDLIQSHKGSLLVITHNRYLLNHCFNKILHLENMELQEYDGSYMKYNISLLQKKIELQELASADSEEIERNKLIINKMRSDATYYTSASRGRTLHARVSLVERLEARKIKDPFVEIKQPLIEFSTARVSEDEAVLRVHDYSACFEDTLLDHVSFDIKSTDKVALIGPNGSGKTTLLRDIFHRQQPSIDIQEDTEHAFLSQLQGEMLNESNTILEEFLDMGFHTSEEVFAHLKNYGFEQNSLSQKISALSGGEKNLLQLAKIAWGNAGLLLLDEPTSHLDTYSQLALEKALTNYNGAILMVSHDFYTIANCMDYVLLIEDKSIRRMSIRKFRQMIYAKYFDKDYLAMAEKKKTLETKISMALLDRDFQLAREIFEASDF